MGHIAPPLIWVHLSLKIPPPPKTKTHKKTYYVQLYTTPLVIYLITVGLGAFIGLQYGVPNPPSKLLFQPDMTSAEAHTSSSLTNTSPSTQRPLWLAFQQPNQQLR